MEEYSSWLLERIAIGDVIRLRIGVSSIGRHIESHIRITGSTFVSRNHAEIVVSKDDQSVEVHDLDSVNGIFVNDSIRQTTCRLHTNDRIGIGVTVTGDEDDAHPEHPVYLLKYSPIRRVLSRQSSTAPQQHLSNLKLTATSAVCSKEETEAKPIVAALHVGTTIVLSDDEDNKAAEPSYRDNINNDLPKILSVVELANVPPSVEAKTQSVTKEPHFPILPQIKQEEVRDVSDNIKNIFGETDEVILNTMREINPHVYQRLNDKPMLTHMNNAKQPLLHGDFICLSDDDVELEVEQIANKQAQATNVCVEERQSPDLFETSLTNLTVVEENACETPEIAANTSAISPATELADYRAEEHFFSSDDEDLIFSQALLNDMKAELADEVENISVRDIKPESIENCATATTTTTNVENANTTENENSFWISDEDDEFDQELENKVSGWSNKLFSQSFTQLSQVYEIKDDDDDDVVSTNAEGNKEAPCEVDAIEIEDNDDDDFFCNNLYSNDLNDVDRRIKELFNSIDKKFGRTSDEHGDAMEQEATTTTTSGLKDSPVIKRSAVKTKRVFSSSEDESEIPKKQMRMRKKRSVKQTERDSGKDDETTRQEKELENKKPEKPLSTTTANSTSNIPATTTTKTTSTTTAITTEPPKAQRMPPLVIDAPLLPRHKGKHRGVSAHKLNNILEDIRQERYTSELKQKWLEKPNMAKARQKEQMKTLKDTRRKRLRELAEEKSANESTDAKPKRISENEQQQRKIAHVKVTSVNRGAFLAEENVAKSATTKRKTFTIPKMKSTDIEGTNATTVEMEAETETVTQQTSNESSASKDKQPKPTEEQQTKAICKEKVAARAQRTTNKITFASMQKNFIESHQNQQKLQIIAQNRSCLTNTVQRDANGMRKKKSVRFNETPLVHYIERVSGAARKVDQKDAMPPSTYLNRRNAVRSNYAVVDCTDQIITLILQWSNTWLIKRNAELESAGEIMYPMPQQFTSFEHYKNILLPLMHIEFVSGLQRDYKAKSREPSFKVTLENAILNNERWMLVTKYYFQNKCNADAIRCDLVILDLGSNRGKTFAYLSANRMGAVSCNTLIFEIIAKHYTKEYLSSIKELQVRPVVDNVRVEFGAFNAVYQLESTPLLQQILNPLELLKCKPQPKRKIKYKGYDVINEKQNHVLLNTYAKAIDETTPNITLIQGPPGTGKSVVITNLALQTLYGDEVRILDKKILICAQSNTAVDVIAMKLYKIKKKMRPDTMFRIVRFGILEKIHPYVVPISLQKIVERDQLRKLLARNKNIHIENKESLHNQILELEAEIAEMRTRNVAGTVAQDELVEKQRQLQLMRNISNQCLRPEDERSVNTWHLSNANIVCATLSSCVKLSQYVDYFDICIIDEATQCTEPWTLLPLKFSISSLVLVGDTQQLPATVLSKKARDYGLCTSLFTRIKRSIDAVQTNEAAAAVLCSLQTQYRMHPEICKWPNLYFYKNELINAPITLQRKTPIKPFSILNLAYDQNEHCGDGKFTNDLEADFVAKLLKALDGFIPNKYNSYGVITPYAEQRNTLLTAIRSVGLTNIMVNTIDSYQGFEKDVIIISNARTNGVGFLSTYQRLNVALTRPRKCLILCGNFKNLESVPVWRSLLNNAKERELHYDISVANALDVYAIIEQIKCKKSNNAKTEIQSTTETPA